MMNVELYQHLDADGRCWLDERAAIREYDGGATQQDAEEAAAREYERVFCAIIPPKPSPANQGGTAMMNRFLREEEGQDIVEYSLLLVLIGAAALFVLTSMGTSISEIFSKINTRLEGANKAIS